MRIDGFQFVVVNPENGNLPRYADVPGMCRIEDLLRPPVAGDHHGGRFGKGCQPFSETCQFIWRTFVLPSGVLLNTLNVETFQSGRETLCPVFTESMPVPQGVDEGERGKFPETCQKFRSLTSDFHVIAAHMHSGCGTRGQIGIEYICENRRNGRFNQRRSHLLFRGQGYNHAVHSFFLGISHHVRKKGVRFVDENDGISYSQEDFNYKYMDSGIAPARELEDDTL